MIRLSNLLLTLLLPVLVTAENAVDEWQNYMIESRGAVQRGDPADFIMAHYRPRKDRWVQWMICREAFQTAPVERERAVQEIAAACADIRRGRQWPHRKRPAYAVPYLDVPPRIDGKLGDEWAKALRLNNSYHLDNPDPVSEKHPAQWYLGWNRQYFFVAGNFFAKIPEKFDNKSWKDCSAEFFLLPSLELGIYREWIFTPDNRLLSFLIRDNSFGHRDYLAQDKADKIQSAVRRTAEGFVLEAAIPFSLLPNYRLGNSPRAGQNLYVMAVQLRQGKFFSPFPLLYDSHNSACFANITLQ